jgi:hypothetical protein
LFIWDFEDRGGEEEAPKREKGCGSRCGVLFTVLVELAEARRAQKYDRGVAVSLHAEEGVEGERE